MKPLRLLIRCLMFFFLIASTAMASHPEPLRDIAVLWQIVQASFLCGLFWEVVELLP
jgi:hypothetical protein